MPLTRSEVEAKLSIPALAEYPSRHADPFFAYSVPGERAVDSWKSLRKIAPGLGYWPVILGQPKDFERTAQLVASEHAESPNKTLEEASRLDVQAFFERRAEEFTGEHAHGEWPNSIQGMDDFTLPRNILKPNEFHKSVYIGLVPSQNPWEVPAQLSFGGWNDCPAPEEQTAVLHYWNQTYGAELVGLSNDVMEMQVPRRPSSKEAALHLAQEQYWFCYDIVEQGVGTIENLAATLLVSDIWYFWWD